MDSEHQMYSCPDCEAQFTSITALSEHEMEMHPSPFPVSYTCLLCELEFTFEHSFYRHMAADHDLGMEGVPMTGPPDECIESLGQEEVADIWRRVAPLQLPGTRIVGVAPCEHHPSHEVHLNVLRIPVAPCTCCTCQLIARERDIVALQYRVHTLEQIVGSQQAAIEELRVRQEGVVQLQPDLLDLPL